jgi:AP-1 complex subunit beta-1
VLLEIPQASILTFRRFACASPEMVEDRGFLDILRDLICDSNPTVVANAVAALSEIQETSGRDVMLITTSVLQKLLAALNECTEWGQVGWWS